MTSRNGRSATNLGAAGSGTHHWWMQRVTAVALVPLSLWLVAALVARAGIGQAGMVLWLSHPVNAALMILTLLATFYHAWLGLTVVVEDYVQGAAVRYALLLALKGAIAFLGLVAVLSVLALFLSPT